MTQASKEPGDLGVLGVSSATSFFLEFPLMAHGPRRVHFHVEGLLELHWGRSELYWYGAATLLVRYRYVNGRWYVIATLLGVDRA